MEFKTFAIPSLEIIVVIDMYLVFILLFFCIYFSVTSEDKIPEKINVKKSLMSLRRTFFKTSIHDKLRQNKNKNNNINIILFLPENKNNCYETVYDSGVDGIMMSI